VVISDKDRSTCAVQTCCVGGKFIPLTVVRSLIHQRQDRQIGLVSRSGQAVPEGADFLDPHLDGPAGDSDRRGQFVGADSPFQRLQPLQSLKQKSGQHNLSVLRHFDHSVKMDLFKIPAVSDNLVRILLTTPIAYFDIGGQKTPVSYLDTVDRRV